MGESPFPRAFTAARGAGVLLRVVGCGHFAEGDKLVVEDVPAHGVTAADGGGS